METITKVARYTTDKKGDQLKTKTGRPYVSQRIQIQSKPDLWISGFENPITAGWKEGDSVDIVITQNDKYWNWALPKKEDESNKQLTMLLNDMVLLKLAVAEIHAAVVPKQKAKIQGTDIDYPEEDNETAF